MWIELLFAIVPHLICSAVFQPQMAADVQAHAPSRHMPFACVALQVLSCCHHLPPAPGQAELPAFVTLAKHTMLFIGCKLDLTGLRAVWRCSTLWKMQVGPGKLKVETVNFVHATPARLMGRILCST